MRTVKWMCLMLVLTSCTEEPNEPACTLGTAGVYRVQVPPLVVSCNDGSSEEIPGEVVERFLEGDALYAYGPFGLCDGSPQYSAEPTGGCTAGGYMQCSFTSEGRLIDVYCSTRTSGSEDASPTRFTSKVSCELRSGEDICKFSATMSGHKL
jgi:hypothetical protein